MDALSGRITLVPVLLVTALLTAACGGGGGGGGGGAPGNAPAREWIIPTTFVANGGPGKDGIPALVEPAFAPISANSAVGPFDLVLAVQTGNQVKVYPQDILDWHEVVNETAEGAPFVLSYCPLTASAVAWRTSATDTDPTFGVSGLLFNSNLLLYDRWTDSYWSQMLQLSVSGSRRMEEPTNIQVIETTFATVESMYPNAVVLTRDTGHARNYDNYPYGNYRSNRDLLFSVERGDNRLHEKARAIGIHNDNQAKVYQLDGFGSSTQTVHDNFDGQPIVVAGNSAESVAVIYSRMLSDGTILQFDPIQSDLPNIMQDTEGNVWDIFGTAQSGPRAGAQLELVKSYSAMWFAWVAHFDTVEVHFN